MSNTDDDDDNGEKKGEKKGKKKGEKQVEKKGEKKVEKKGGIKEKIKKAVKQSGEQLAKISGVIGATTAAVAGSAKLALTAVGFSSAGPVAGSLAAGFQASIGNVAAGSTFSILQAVGMGGMTPFLGPALGVGTIAGGGYYWLKKSKL